MSNIVQIKVPRANNIGDSKSRFQTALNLANQAFSKGSEPESVLDYGKIWEVLKEVFAAMVNKTHKEIGLEDVPLGKSTITDSFR